MMQQQQPQAKQRRGVARRALGWLVRAVVVIGVLVFVVHEVGVVVVANARVDGIASDAAEQAGAEYARSHSTDKARAVAKRVAREEGARVAGFEVTRLTGSVGVTIHKTADTWLIRRIGFVRRFGVARATRRASAA